VCLRVMLKNNDTAVNKWATFNICRSQWAHCLKAWVCGCWLAVSVVCCQVEVSAMGWSLSQGNPTKFGVCDCDHKAWTVRRPTPTRVVEPLKKIINHLIFMTKGALLIEHALYNELLLYHLPHNLCLLLQFNFLLTCKLPLALLLTMQHADNIVASANSACCMMVSFKLICLCHYPGSFYFEPYARQFLHWVTEHVACQQQHFNNILYNKFLYNMQQMCTGSMMYHSSSIICSRYVLAVWCITVLV
jgi:hypothetical protein